MTARSRILAGVNSPPPQTTSSLSSASSQPNEFAVIIVALICAFICLLGLLVVSRCSWIRRLPTSNTNPSPASNKGLKKKVLNSFPKLTYRDGDEQTAKFSECPICLVKYAAGDEIRVLPQCGHGFHVGCIDTWLGSHSSCPSCRQIWAVESCQKCADVPAVTPCAGAGRILPEPRENHVNSILP